MVIESEANAINAQSSFDLNESKGVKGKIHTRTQKQHPASSCAECERVMAECGLDWTQWGDQVEQIYEM